MRKRLLAMALTAVMVCALAVPAGAHDMGKVGSRRTISVVTFEGTHGAFAMVIDEDGGLWRIKAQGQNEGGEMKVRTVAEKIMDDVATVHTVNNHVAVIKTDGSLWAWWELDFTFNPKKKLDDVAAVSVGQCGAGKAFYMAIKTDGSLWSWGGNGCGQLGNGTTTDSTSPVKIMDDVDAVAAGNFHTMAIKTDGTLWGWGHNQRGELGIGTGKGTRYDGVDPNHYDQTIPIKVMDNVVAVSASEHTMAIKSDGSLWGCGGYNDSLGHGGEIDSAIPAKIMDNVVAVTTYEERTMAIQADGSLWAWGENYQGTLGRDSDKVLSWGGPRVVQTVPMQVMDNVEEVSTCDVNNPEQGRTIVKKTDGTIWMWGGAFYDQNSGYVAVSGAAPVQVILEESPPVVTVTLNGGSGSTVLELNADGTLKKPADPTREGYIFAGWYTDSSFTTKWDFSKKVTGDMSLYAGWLPAVKIIFQLGGETTTIDTAQNEPMKVPTNPTKEGYTFGGWYTDEALTTPWNFNSAVTGELALYARWTPVSSTAATVGQNTQDISFNGNKVAVQGYTLKADNGGDVTYVKLRDVAALMDGTSAQFNVDWRNGAIYVERGKGYTTRNGTELKPVIGVQGTYRWNTAPVLFDGETKPLEGLCLSTPEGDHTFFKLRDLGAALGFTVDWSADTGITIQAK